MNIEQLQYIIEVSELGTIAKAADKLHVSHSAISQAIANLESELESRSLIVPVQEVNVHQKAKQL